MDLKLPLSIQLEARTRERWILARRTATCLDYVTVDFEQRRWQLGKHPTRILSPMGQPYTGRRWRETLVGDASQALLALTPELPGETPAGTSPSVSLAEPLHPPVGDLRAYPPRPPARAYAWKVMASGQISQAVTERTPETLFQQAGFRPHRVQDPIQGFLAVPVQLQGDVWVEVLEP